MEEERVGTVICPRCQVRNRPSREACSRCGADLLPGRSSGERVKKLIVTLVVSFVLFVLATLATKDDSLACLVRYLYLQGFVVLVGGLVWSFGRTPSWEKYLRRAQRHLQLVPEQALADLSISGVPHL